jgi:hypothetical protein
MAKSTINSTMATNLTLHQMTTPQGHDAYQEPRRVQTKAVKNMLGTSARVPIDADILAHKLRLFGQLKLQPQHSYQRHISRLHKRTMLRSTATMGRNRTTQQFTAIPTEKLSEQRPHQARVHHNRRELATRLAGTTWRTETRRYYSLLYHGGKAKHLRSGTRKR